MKNPLTLNRDTRDAFEATDIVAFSYPGACGHPGVIRAITRDKRLWEINYYTDAERLNLKVYSILEEILSSFRSHQPLPIGWMRLNTGLGTCLFLTDDLRQNISIAGLHPAQIYREWEDLILQGLERIERRSPLIDEIDKERLSPEWIESLDENEIFVFGSNIFGYHDGGASEQAMCRFGAIYGKPQGIQGQSYAIITDGVSYSDLMAYVIEFLKYAETHPEQTFLVTKLGCGTAGYHESQIAPLFTRAVQIPNILLPRDFMKYLL
jgi:hypothetical protein